MVPSSYKVQICSLFSASTRSFISLSLKYIISAYDVVNIKCHNVVLSLNSKMDINLEGSVHCWVELQTCSSISLSVCLVVFVSRTICIGGKHFVTLYTVY